MKKVILTIGIDCNSNCFQHLTQYKKVNALDLLRSDKANKSPLRQETVRIRALANAIAAENEHLLIGNAINTKDSLLALVEILEGKRYIETIYHLSKKARRSITDGNKEFHKTHSNWVQYPPEFVESRHFEQEKELGKSFDFAKELPINLIAVD